MESQKFKQIEEKFVMYIGLPLFGCFLIYLWFFEDNYAESFRKETFEGVVFDKRLDKDRPTSYWYLTLSNPKTGNLYDTTKIDMGNLAITLRNFGDFYDYLQVGDTVHKVKDSLVVEVKNGARYRVFRGVEKKR
jgi:hypothetical protein